MSIFPFVVFVAPLHTNRSAHLSFATLVFIPVLIIVSLTACTPKQAPENKENNRQDHSQGQTPNPPTSPLRLAAAANLAQVLPSIIESYQSDASLCPDTDDCAIEVTYASSGKLYAQINAGAPYDIYLAANQSFPAKLATPPSPANLPFNYTPFTYTQGQLALYSRSQEPHQKSNIAQLLLAQPNSKITIANPELAPYGTSAQAYLQSQGIYEQLLAEKRLIQAENIGQAFQYVHTGNVDFGFVALSQLIATQTEPSHYQTLTVNDYPAILQDGIMLSAHPNAVSFADYLLSATAQKIFVDAGYLAVTSK